MGNFCNIYGALLSRSKGNFRNMGNFCHAQKGTFVTCGTFVTFMGNFSNFRNNGFLSSFRNVINFSYSGIIQLFSTVLVFYFFSNEFTSSLYFINQHSILKLFKDNEHFLSVQTLKHQKMVFYSQCFIEISIIKWGSVKQLSTASKGKPKLSRMTHVH